MVGYSIFHFDNVEGVIKSPVLASALTSPDWSDRKLCSNVLFQGKQQLTWVATGNNIVLGGDMGRRCYGTLLDARAVEPWKRPKFRHPNIDRWVRENRGQLLGALLTFIRAWIVAGQPLFTDVVMGSFEDWTEITGGILVNAGYHGFLANLDATYDQMASEENNEWLVLFEALLHWKQDQVFTAKEVSEVVMSDENSSIRDALPSSIRLSYQKNSSNLPSALGTFFQRHQGRRFRSGDIQYYLNGSETVKRGAHLWSFSKDTPH
jgi:hypothetical protein